MMNDNNNGWNDQNRMKILKNEISNLKKEIAFKDEIFGITPNYILIIGLDGEILEVNSSVKNLNYRVDDAEIPAQLSQLNIIPSNEFYKYTQSIDSIFNNKINEPFESFLLGNGGGIRYVKVDLSPVKAEDEIIAISILARDITDLKLMEDSLQESLAIQEATLESVSNGIVVVNNHKKVICYNHKFLKMWNIPEELLESDENHVLNHISTSLEDPVEFQSIIKNIYQHPLENSTHILRFKDGRVYKAYSQPHITDHTITGRVWSFHDITHLKQTKKSLKESVAYYKTIFEHSGTATLIIEEDNTISLVNSESEKILGYPPYEVMGKKTWLDFVVPECQEQMREYRELRYKNSKLAPDNYEFRLVDKEGEVKDIMTNICIIPGTKRILASILDITERNEVLEKITDSENKYRTLAEAVEDFIFMFDKNERLEYINEYAARKWKLNRQEVMGKPRSEIFPPEENELQSKYIQRVVAIKKTLRGENLVTMCPDSMWLDTALIPLKNNGDDVEKVLCVARDITERKEYELLLGRQNEIHKSMGTILTEAILSETEEELSQTCLTVCQDITGSEFGFICEKDEYGSFQTRAISEDLLTKHNLLNTDFYPLLRKLNIKIIWEELKTNKKPLIYNHFSPLKVNSLGEDKFPKNILMAPLLKNGEFMGLIGLCNKKTNYDFSDSKAMESISTTIVEALLRKRAEEKLKKALHDKEMLVREIHHRTKNNLMIMASLLNLTSADIEDEKAREIFHQIQTRAKSMALIHEKLYQSTNSKEINFGEYIRHLSRDLFHTFLREPGRVQLVLGLEDLNLDIDTAIPLGLILNELLTNSMKYAFPEESYGTITVKFYKKDEKYVMKVNDDGIGLPSDLDVDKTDTLGLQLIKNLIGQIDAEIKIQVDHGTQVTIKFSEKDYLS